MNKAFTLILPLIVTFNLIAQTPLTEALDFHVKTVEGETIKLFELLDDENKIVVIDFFSTTCGPCQTYAPDFQTAYETFGSNNNNVFFVAINYGADNDGVIAFDSTYGITLPSVSGLQGGGDYVYIDYEIVAYPTVIVITPDHQIVEQFIWPPVADSIIDAVYEAGGVVVGTAENHFVAEKAVVFPNPVNGDGFLKIEVDGKSKLEFEIYDAVGHRMKSAQSVTLNNGENSIKLDVNGFQNGLYFLKYQVGTCAWQTARFLISR